LSEKAEELLRSGRVGEGLRELERVRRTLLEAGDATALRELAERAEVTPDKRFTALAYAARQNVAYLERLGELGEKAPVMTKSRMLVVALGILAGVALWALYVWALQGV
jgi:hypothetical protein